MRRIDLIISLVRKLSRTENFSTTSGVQDAEMLQFATEAHRFLHAKAVEIRPEAFDQKKVINAVNGTKEYSIPSDSLLGRNISTVEYSKTGNVMDFYFLDPLNKRNRDDRNRGSAPYGYILQGTSILLEGTPQENGLIRISYAFRLPRLDTRRAQVLSVTLGTNTVDALTFDTTVNFDYEEINTEELICIVDKNGNQKMRGIPLTVNSSSGVATIDAGFQFEDGETIEVGDYAVLGSNTTTHSQLPDECEDFLINYMKAKALGRNASSDGAPAMDEAQMLAESIIANMASPSADIIPIPLTDRDWFYGE